MSPDNPISTIPVNPSLDIDTTGNLYVNQSRAYIYIYIYVTIKCSLTYIYFYRDQYKHFSR